MATTLAEYRARLDREPLTRYQLGAIHREFDRLGFHLTADRDERLWLTSELAGTGPLDSTKNLTMGQAGRVIGILTECRALEDLYSIADICVFAEPKPRGILAALAAWLTN